MRTISLGDRWGETGRTAGEIKACRHAMDSHSHGAARSLGNNHPETLDLLVELGLSLERRGRLDEAEATLRRALEGRHDRGVVGGMRARAQRELAALLRRRGQKDEAADLLRQSEVTLFGMTEHELHPRQQREAALQRAASESTVAVATTPIRGPKTAPPITLRELGLALAAKSGAKQQDLEYAEALMQKSVAARVKVWGEGEGSKTHHATSSLDDIVRRIGRAPLSGPPPDIVHECPITGDVLLIVPHGAPPHEGFVHDHQHRSSSYADRSNRFRSSSSIHSPSSEWSHA